MIDNNGWADRPGVPLNPELNRFHWLLRKGEQWPEAWRWDPDADGCGTEYSGAWAESEGDGQPEYMAKWYLYLGPCLTPAEVDARVKEARRDALAGAARMVKLYAQNALKCAQCGDIRHDYNPGNCSGEKTYRESEEYKRKVLFDGEYSAMRYFQKHLCRPEPMDTDEAFKALAAAIRALVDVPSEVIIRADRDAWPDHQAKGMKEQGND